MCYSNSVTLHEILELWLEEKVFVFFIFDIYAKEAAFYLSLRIFSGRSEAGGLLFGQFHIFYARYLYSNGDI